MTLEKLEEILTLDKPSEEIKKNEEEIFEFIPELKLCKGFNQNNDWHPYDVYEHTLHVVDNIENDKDLRLCALFHDIGKPKSYKVDENGVGHFYGHWDKSKDIFKRFAFRNNIDKETRDYISKLITYHDMNLGRLDDNKIKKIKELFTLKELIMLYKLKRADLLAQNEKYHFLLDEYDKQENVYKLFYEKEEL